MIHSRNVQVDMQTQTSKVLKPYKKVLKQKVPGVNMSTPEMLLGQSYSSAGTGSVVYYYFNQSQHLER